jgi:hypothetical protein
MNHKDHLVEDFTRSCLPDQAEMRALAEIQAILLQSSLTCRDLGLPVPDDDAMHSTDQTVDIQAETDIANQNLALLNPQQHALVDAVFTAVTEVQLHQPSKCRAFFLDGPGGSGKTMVYNTLISALRIRGLQVSAAAWTGIAATLLRGGRTVHSLFKLPVPILDTSTCNVTPTSVHAAMLRSVTLFIVDEASMVPCHALRAIDALLRDITEQDVPFGGKIFLLGGDFRQVLPVMPRSSRPIIVENCLKSSDLWPLMTKVTLTKNMRARPDQQEFARWLLQLGNGALHSVCQEAVANSIDIPPQCVVSGSIIDAVFPDLTCDLTKRAILTPKNDTSLDLNDQVLERLPGERRLYLSVDNVVSDDENERQNYPLEFLNSLTPSGMPQHRLYLKVGSIVMLLRNLDVRKGFCNGTRLIIRRMEDHVLDAQIISSTHAGESLLIPRIQLAPSDVNLPFVLQRRQFPVRLAYCMTINKAQGQTFDKVGIYLPAPVFTHGQLYVAFSRAKSFSDVHIKIDNTSTQGLIDGTTVTQNIVYPEVL